MAPLLKELYNSAYVTLLATKLKEIEPSFNTEKFFNDVFDVHWEKKELKTRMQHIAVSLHKNLLGNYKKDVKLLQELFLKVNDKHSLENMLFAEYVALYGKDEPILSLDALEVFTINSSSEFAIREFLLLYEASTLERIYAWTQSKNEHIRRLSSEGVRPRLPWAKALPKYKKDPTPLFKIIEHLQHDSSPYVRKSVANLINDISKDHPEITLKLLRKLLKNRVESSLVKHAARTLLKAANKDALELFGYEIREDITLESLHFLPELSMGEEQSFSFRLTTPKKLGKLRIEFALHLLRKNGTYNTKVFQIAQKEYDINRVEIQKNYSFKNITTRKYYRGEQKISIIVNGDAYVSFSFMLT